MTNHSIIISYLNNKINIFYKKLPSISERELHTIYNLFCICLVSV